MPLIVEQTAPENLLPSWPVRMYSGQTEPRFRPASLNSRPLRVGRGNRVLHSRLGTGQVLHVTTRLDQTVTVAFQNGIVDVPGASLRRIVPVTELARLIAATASHVTAWTVRKANEQGTIQPDALGRFAGHNVHYYDVARIPALVDQLSEQDSWRINTLVLHAQYGPGRITGRGREANIANSSREVDFFGSSCAMSVCVQQLRRLLPSHSIAKSIGVDRRRFPTLAAQRGIYPDYVAPHGRVREFYDESRIENIRNRWSVLQPDEFSPGNIVLDAEGDIVRIECRDARGQAHVRELHVPAPSRVAHITSLHELVSLRELARTERMSRYKVNRLLTAAGIQPVFQIAKTHYYDKTRAHQAVQGRLQREGNAVTLGELAARTGVSEAVLARKIRGGSIRTLGHHATHRVEPSEAQRIEHLVRALQSGSESLRSLGICQVHPRGRRGEQVVSWDISRLAAVVRSASSDSRKILFGQVAWMCDGAGQKRFREALEAQLLSLETIAERLQLREAADCLLALIDSLPGEFGRERSRLVLMACGATDAYRLMEERVRTLLDTRSSDGRKFDRFHAQADQCLTEQLEADHADVFVPAAGTSLTTQGAIVASRTDGEPEAGVVVRVEHQCWDVVSRCWHQTLVVRFADGERRLNDESVVVLLRRSEVESVLRGVQQRRASELRAA